MAQLDRDHIRTSHQGAIGISSAQTRDLYWHATDAAHWTTGPRFGCVREGFPGHQLMFIVGGSGSGPYLGESWRARAGQAVLMDLRLPHEYHSDPEDPWEMYWVIVDGPDIDAHFQAITLGEGAVVPFASRPGIARTFSRLFAAMQGQRPGHAAWVHHHLTALFADLLEARCMRAGQPAAAGSSQPRRRSGIQRALELLRSAHARTISLDELARLAQLSPSHFVRSFKDRTGFTPFEYLERYRVARAQELLRTQPGMPAAEVGLAVGYADPAYFSRVFRDETGAPPSALR